MAIEVPLSLERQAMEEDKPDLENLGVTTEEALSLCT